MSNIRATRQRTKKRVQNYFHLCSSSMKETPEGRAIMLNEMEVARWFSIRHEGDRHYKRDCIRQSIARLRVLKDGFLSNVGNTYTH